MLKIYGNYSVICETDNFVYAAVDNICSFPLFYMFADGDIVLTDSLDLLKKSQKISLDEHKKEEFYACGFSLGNSTVYSGVYQLQGGQCLIYNKITNTAEINDYYLHVHKPDENQDFEYLSKKFDVCIDNVMQRMIRSINGRTIVLFLSGGYDSKLVLSSLRRINYENVICVSCGGMDTKDVAVAKEIAEKLKYKWLRIDVNQKTWREFRNTEYFSKYFQIYARYSACPYLQGIAIRKLIDNGILSGDCVAITGNSGDAIEGADVTRAFKDGQIYSNKDILEAIRYKHFILNGTKESEKIVKKIDLSNYSKYITADDDSYNAEQCEEIFEFFNWRERQCKYVVNDLHNYEDVMNIDWRLPLWDREFQDFWLSVGYKERYGRNFYYYYVKGEKLPSANDISFRRKIFNQIKKLLGRTIDVLYIPKSIWNYKFSTKYYFAPYGLLRFGELLKILRNGSGNRAPHMEGVVRLMYSRY